MKIYKLAIKVLSGKSSIKNFSLLTGKSYRQSQRIIQKVQEQDYLGVIHGNSGRDPANKTPEKIEALIVDLLTYKYQGFNVTHFYEMLVKNEKLKVSQSVVHRIARKHGLIKNPRRCKRRSFKPRPRMPQEGMLVQLDGSQHLWFGKVKTDLIAGIDDATGKILKAEFFLGEKSLHSMKVIKDLVDEHGLPEAFYMDQAGIYGKLDREWESQIARAFNQVNIRLILASSPQAKGRVERLFRTLQDRLIAELKFYNIEDMDAANRFLKEEFIPKFNKQFSVEPQYQEKTFRKNVFGKLDYIFCRKEKRKIAVGNTFSYDAVTWLLNEKTCFRGREVNINTHIDGRRSFDIMGREIRAKVVSTKRIYANNKRAV